MIINNLITSLLFKIWSKFLFFFIKFVLLPININIISTLLKKSWFTLIRMWFQCLSVFIQIVLIRTLVPVKNVSIFLGVLFVCIVFVSVQNHIFCSYNFLNHPWAYDTCIFQTINLFWICSQCVTVNSEIIAIFLLLQIMRLSDNHNNKNSHSYICKLHVQTGFLKIALSYLTFWSEVSTSQ